MQDPGVILVHVAEAKEQVKIKCFADFTFIY
jgi:hypothetical protein